MAKNKKPVKSCSRTFQSLFYFGKILGINTYTLSKSNQLNRSYPNIIYVIFLQTSFVYLAYRFVIDRKNAILPGETPLSVIMDFISTGLVSLEVLIALSLCLFSHNRIQSILKSFRRIAEYQIRLKIEDDYEKDFSRLAISLTMFDCLYIIRNNCNNKVFDSDEIHIVTWVSYGFFQLIPLNSIVLFIWLVMILREKFHRLNETIKKFIDNNNRAGPLRIATNEASLKIEENSSHSPFQHIVTISELHRELRNAMNLIREYFGPLVLLNTLEQLFVFTICAHVLYRYVKVCEHFTSEDVIYTVHFIFWLIPPLIMMFLISTACGSLTEKANDTGNILHAILNEYQVQRSDQEISELNFLILDLLQNKMKIALLGFVGANYFLMCSMLTTATSYLTIMLQFYD